MSILVHNACILHTYLG